MRIYLDIETARSQQDVDLSDLPPVPNDGDLVGQEPKSYKSDKARAEWRAAQIDKIRQANQDEGRKRWERTSLEPMDGWVLCVGIAVGDADPVVLWGADEAATLDMLDRGLARYPDAEIVAHNGLGFDFRFLGIRALHHKLYRLAARMYAPKKWGNRGLVDTYQVWQAAGWRERGKLPDVARLLGYDGPITTDVTGANVHDLYVAGETDKIRQHVIEDVLMLRHVTQELDAAGWLR